MARASDQPGRAERTRKTMIDIARRRQRPGSGSNLRELMKRTPPMNWPDLRAALAGIPWAVAGAVATRSYMPERATRRLDIVTSPGDVPEVARKLESAGYERQRELAIGGSAWRSPDGVPVDVIECNEPWCPAAVAEAATTLDVQGYPVLPLAYLALMKMQSSRLVDVGDLGRMLGLADETSLARVRQTFAQYAPGLTDDLESMIALGKLETEGEPPA